MAPGELEPCAHPIWPKLSCHLTRCWPLQLSSDWRSWIGGCIAEESHRQKPAKGDRGMQCRGHEQPELLNLLNVVNEKS